jgi:shikimate kinase
VSLIALVGMPGSGKSTVARLLARQLNWRVVDCDAEIEKQIGCPISEYFQTQGEPAFRDVEQETIARLVQLPSAVLATGGGAVLREANRAALKARCEVVYLRSTPEELYRRLRRDTQRPLLQVSDPLRRLRDLLREREPLYRETARYVIETGRPSVPMLVNMILMQLELAGVIDPSLVPATVGRASPITH